IEVFQEYLSAGTDALLVPPADARALAEAMEALMVDGELRDRLRVGGQRVVRRFTWPESARRHLGIYRDVVADKW
ncbi:MAG: hypothetical protein QOK39_2206, partial [Acidimicrobiaceae bacterium]|nr:hypothetical protein [Acidimicrobiaceae bacterium]